MEGRGSGSQILNINVNYYFSPKATYAERHPNKKNKTKTTQPTGCEASKAMHLFRLN